MGTPASLLAISPLASDVKAAIVEQLDCLSSALSDNASMGFKQLQTTPAWSVSDQLAYVQRLMSQQHRDRVHCRLDFFIAYKKEMALHTQQGNSLTAVMTTFNNVLVEVLCFSILCCFLCCMFYLVFPSCAFACILNFVYVSYCLIVMTAGAPLARADCISYFARYDRVFCLIYYEHVWVYLNPLSCSTCITLLICVCVRVCVPRLFIRF